MQQLQFAPFHPEIFRSYNNLPHFYQNGEGSPIITHTVAKRGPQFKFVLRMVPWSDLCPNIQRGHVSVVRITHASCNMCPIIVYMCIVFEKSWICLRWSLWVCEHLDTLLWKLTSLKAKFLLLFWHIGNEDVVTSYFNKRSKRSGLLSLFDKVRDSVLPERTKRY